MASLPARIREALGLGRPDVASLAGLAPLVATAAATCVIVSSAAKALFLSHNPLVLVPWLLAGGAVAAAVLAGLHLALSRLLGPTLLPLAVPAAVGAVLAALRIAYPGSPAAVSLALYLLLPGLTQVLALQAWNAAGRALPPRQGKRLFPLLAAVATLGAAGGGAVVQAWVAIGTAEDLLWAALGFLAAMAVAGHRAAGRVDVPNRRAAAPRQGTAAGLGALVRIPLLRNLAAFAFLVQVALSVLEYAFSGQLQAAYGKEDLARFLGRFSLGANLVVVAVSLGLAGRILRTAGAGTVLALSALGLAVTAALYGVAGLAGLPALGAVVLAALAGHVGQHGLTRSAVQVALAPLDPAVAERGRAAIDGVLVRVAVALAAAGLLAAGVGRGRLHLLGFAIAAVAGVAGLAAWGLTRHYATAVERALKDHARTGLPPAVLGTVLGRFGLRELEARLADPDPAVARRALAFVRDVRAAVSPALLDRLAGHDDPGVVGDALAALRALKARPGRDRLASLLAPDRPPEVIQEALHLALDPPDPSLADRVAALAGHPVPAVASAAALALLALRGPFPGSAARAPETALPPAVPAGAAQAGDYADSVLRQAASPDLDQRIAALQSMGTLRLPAFVEPLADALADRRLRPCAVASLQSLGAAALPGIARRLDERPGHTVRIALYRALAGTGLPAARDLLAAQAATPDLTLRTEAVLALWRMTRDGPAGEAGTAVADARVLEEVERLEAYAGVAAGAAPPGPHGPRFQAAVEAARQAALRRVLLLLGMRTDRAALYRVWLNLRAGSARARSNALELLESRLRGTPFAGLVRVLEADGGAAARPAPGADGAGIAAGDRLVIADPWLGALHRWALDRGGDGALSWDDPPARAFVLRDVPGLAEVDPRALSTLADASHVFSIEAGARLVEAGSTPGRLLLLLEGTLALWRDGREACRVGPGEVLGEAAVLDSRPYEVAVTAVTAARLLDVPAWAYEDVMDDHPEVGRSLVRRLAARVCGTGWEGQR